MATLASIPEANTTLSNTKNTSRPRSRVVFLSKRPGRIRCPVRTPALPKRTVANRVHDAQQHAVDDKKIENKDILTGAPDAGEAAKVSKSALFSPQKAAVQDVSDTSFDLDSFPRPPSNSPAASHVEPLRRNVSIMKSRQVRPAPKPPPVLAQRRLLVPKQQNRAQLRNSVAEVVKSLSSSNSNSVDSAVIEAVSRSIAQQLRLVSTMRRGRREVSKFSVSSTSPDDAASRTPSQKRALKRFTRDIEAYADITGAAGKTLAASPTPLASAATLKTVSALMPFRPELRAAGLAVTSRDQQTYSSRLKDDGKQTKQRGKVRAGYEGNPSQLDGNGRSGSSNTEISFAESHKMDEWRYALIEEAPVGKGKKGSKKKRPARGCLPCFPGDGDITTDPEWAHFKPVRTSARKIVRKISTADPKTRLPAKKDRKTPRKAPCEDGFCSSDDARPRPDDLKTAGGRVKPAPPAHQQTGGPSFITTGRRHSMAIPKDDLGSVECNIRHRRRNIETRYPEESLVYMSGSATGRRKYQHQLRQADMTRAGPSQISLYETRQMRDVVDAPPRSRLQVYAETDTVSEHQVDGLAGRLATAVGTTKPTLQKRTKSHRKSQVPQFKYDPYHLGICCPSTRGVPAKAIARPNIPKRTSSIKESSSSLEMDCDDAEIPDRDVLRGLHVAASAACNEEVDAFVRVRTGLRVRKFLADLMVLENLTAALPNEKTEQHARRRRAEMRKLKQQVRRSREIATTGGVI